MLRPQTPTLRRLVLGVALLPLFVLAPQAQAQAPDCPELEQAQDRYDNGRFEEVITLATTCLDRTNVNEAKRQRAYRLIGLSYIGQDLRDNAREAVRQLITLVPNFEPDPVNDPPQFIQMIDEVKEAEAERLAEEARRATEEADPEAEAEEPAGPTEAELQAEADRLAEESRLAEERRAEARRSEDGGGGLLKWILIGGVVVGGGVLAAVLLGGGDDGGGGGGSEIPPPPPPPGL